MKCISDTPRRIVVQTGQEPVVGAGGVTLDPGRRRVEVSFVAGTAPAWAARLWFERFGVHRVPFGSDHAAWAAAHAPYFDTDAMRHYEWREHEIAAAEQTLRQTSGVVEVERPWPGQPFPTYVAQTTLAGSRTLEACINRAVSAVTEDGYDVAALLAFEREAERPESQEIIAALTRLQERETRAA